MPEQKEVIDSISLKHRVAESGYINYWMYHKPIRFLPSAYGGLIGLPVNGGAITSTK